MRRAALLAALALAGVPPALASPATSAPVGGVLTVSLAGNPTTGYRWAVDRVPAGLRLLSHRYVADPQPPGTVGGGGTEIIRFRGLRAGTYRVAFTYRRPFAPQDGASHRTVTLRVTRG